VSLSAASGHATLTTRASAIATRPGDDLRGALKRLAGVDAVGLESRVAKLGTRSLKTTTKARLLDLTITMIDLTTLEGADTSGKVASLCTKARTPDPSDPSVPAVAAVCVYPDLVAEAVRRLAGSRVAVASVATAFPAGRASLQLKIAEVAEAVAAGANEIDMVIDRGAFLSGNYQKVFDEIVAVKAACGSAHLKVILETGELLTYDHVRRASWLALWAGADFIKTSTGKVGTNATIPVTVVMLEAVRDYAEATGRIVGVKAAGGIRTAKDALKYLVAVNETAGSAWLHADAFRFGASSLLNDVLSQRAKQRDGVYVRPDRFSGD
jgi:deoxyribose-phosphate aldolase